MNHGIASGKLLELAYGELSPREARAVEEHAAACADCREELARIRETRALMSLLPAEPAPERGEGLVLAAAREEAAKRVRRGRAILPPWLWAGTAGAMTAAAVAVVSWQLVRTAPGESHRDRQDDLLGPPPRVVVAAPEAAPRSAEESAPVEKRKEGAAAGSLGYAPPAPPAPPAAKAAPGRRPALPSPEPAAAMKREEVGERMPSPQPDAGRAGVASAGTSAGTGARWDRVEPAQALAAPPVPSLVDRESADAERVPATASRAPPAAAQPAPAPAQKARSMAAPERKGAAPVAATDASEEGPRAAPGAVESRAFAGCPGERRRVVERDGEGRLLRYVRVGDRRTLEQRYGPDGWLVSAFVIEDGVRRTLPLDATGLVRQARDAGIDAPPRCEP